jgi:membrane associated rhomboid family serine protease
MEYYAFKLNLAQLGGFLLSIVSAWIMIRKSIKQKRKQKERHHENDQ